MTANPRKALYAGSFDPFTNGHLDICTRALKIFDSLVVVVAKSPSKNSLLALDQRVGLITDYFAGDDRVEVLSWQGLTVDFAKKHKVEVMVRGLRPTGDFDNEFQMALMNRNLGPNIETVFLVSDENKSYVSSSLVKEIWSHGGDISSFVPKSVLDVLRKNNESK